MLPELRSSIRPHFGLPHPVARSYPGLAAYITPLSTCSYSPQLAPNAPHTVFLVSTHQWLPSGPLMLRPPLAQERLHLLPDSLVRIELKRAFRDGTVAIDLDPLSLLCRLAAAVPPPGFHLVHYAGVLGAASKLRPLVIPPPNDESSLRNNCLRTERPTTHRSHYRPWAELMKRAFEIDVLQCPSCGGRLKLKALVIEAHNVERLLRHLGEPLEPPRRSPARDPPYFKSKVLRRKLGELN